MKTTSIQSYFYDTKTKISKKPKLVVKVKGFVKRKCINTLIPNFSYKNHIGEEISPNTCILL
ncbi:MAG: hypothetical protein QM495_06180 [Lutibacter sp.]|uniref:hypothetical protein n=1 Tax=Lutibacter sp. TaxID=1925666 RepID=UPI00385E3CB5